MNNDDVAKEMFIIGQMFANGMARTSEEGQALCVAGFLYNLKSAGIGPKDFADMIANMEYVDDPLAQEFVSQLEERLNPSSNEPIPGMSSPGEGWSP
ncbi:MAG: hypothetical protein IT559_04060 [Alphaproteobacteria bacterium]|nr:hypothetical protein [Alphaproteobacteria bacterium]